MKKSNKAQPTVYGNKIYRFYLADNIKQDVYQYSIIKFKNKLKSYLIQLSFYSVNYFYTSENSEVTDSDLVIYTTQILFIS